MAADPLHIVRAVRLAAKLGFTIDPDTEQDMARLAPQLAGVAVSSVIEEFLLILASSQSFASVQLLDRLGVLSVLFPEIQSMRGCTQNSYHHRDVWQHSLIVLENCEHIVNNLPQRFGEFSRQVAENLETNHRLPLLKLAALLHDVGKPGSKAISPANGRITFYGHDQAGAKIVAVIGERLQLAPQDRSYLSTLVAEHLRVLNLSAQEVKKATRRRWFHDLEDDVIPVIILGMADVKGSLGPDATPAAQTQQLEWSRNAVQEYFTDLKSRPELPKLITGRDLIYLGLPPGPGIGKILQQIDKAQEAGEINDREGALALARQLLARPHA